MTEAKMETSIELDSQPEFVDEDSDWLDTTASQSTIDMYNKKLLEDLEDYKQDPENMCIITYEDDIPYISASREGNDDNEYGLEGKYKKDFIKWKNDYSWYGKTFQEWIQDKKQYILDNEQICISNSLRLLAEERSSGGKRRDVDASNLRSLDAFKEWIQYKKQYIQDYQWFCEMFGYDIFSSTSSDNIFKEWLKEKIKYDLCGECPISFIEWMKEKKEFEKEYLDHLHDPDDDSEYGGQY
jgi:hypothetical protein